MGDALLPTLILVVMCGGMWMLARVAKRRMGVGSGTIAGNALKVVGKRPLDQKHALWVIEIAGGRHILVGTGTDGAVTKLDDISTDEYALMVEDEAQAATPKLRLARPKATATTEPAAADADGANDGDAIQVEEGPRFATVGESFQHFLGKAKNKRASGE
ncbi:MAG: hypothetical protein JWM25_1165 [Thermoleophilia bacterium]|nr:hypothetical protein [Thermoleophilia bacterium]